MGKEEHRISSTKEATKALWDIVVNKDGSVGYTNEEIKNFLAPYKLGTIEANYKKATNSIIENLREERKKMSNMDQVVFDQEQIDVLDCAREHRDAAIRKAQKLNDEAYQFERAMNDKRALARRVLEELAFPPATDDNV